MQWWDMDNPLAKYFQRSGQSVDDFAALSGLSRDKLYRILNGQLPRPKDQVVLESLAGIKPELWAKWGVHLVKIGGVYGRAKSRC